MKVTNYDLEQPLYQLNGEEIFWRSCYSASQYIPHLYMYSVIHKSITIYKNGAGEIIWSKMFLFVKISLF
jgi:hypothetical protein